MNLFTKILLSSALLFSAVQGAEATNSSLPQIEDASVEIQEGEDEFGALADQAEEDFSDEIDNDPAVQHDRWKADFERRSWEWHLTSTKMIFVTVILIVIFGLWISWRQFQKDISDENLADSESNSPRFDVSASLQSVTIKSQTIGALILVFSGIFFFLYIWLVYPMNVVNDGEAESLPPRTVSSSGE